MIIYVNWVQTELGFLSGDFFLSVTYTVGGFQRTNFGRTIFGSVNIWSLAFN